MTRNLKIQKQSKSKWPEIQKFKKQLTSQDIKYKSIWPGNKVKNKVSQNDDKSKSSKNKVKSK